MLEKLKSWHQGLNLSLKAQFQLQSSKLTLKAQFPVLRPEPQQQESNPFYLYTWGKFLPLLYLSLLKLKLHPLGPNLGLAVLIIAPKIKSKPQGSNQSLKAQI